MNTIRIVKASVAIAIVVGLAAGAYVSRDRWLHYALPSSREVEPDEHDHEEPADAPSEQVLLSEQAQKNLKLTSRPLKPETFWKTIDVPGMIIDRPGIGDRGIVAPVTGVVSRIHRVPGETVKPGDALFTLKILSETLHQTQTDLFKATQETKLAEEQKKRLTASGGGVAEARIIDVDSQITRLQVSIKAYRQDLLSRGIPVAQIDAAAGGTFINELVIPFEDSRLKLGETLPAGPAPVTSRIPVLKSNAPAVEYEVQELKVELGQQVQAGQTLCLLSNHRLLSIEGRAFRDESPLLERTVKEGWTVEVDFAEDPPVDWPSLGQAFPVTYIANTVDSESRTFRFLLPLENQSRTIENGGRSQVLWRFRPGQRVRLQVRVESVPDVFVLPAGAVAREGADTYVFRQNGDTFDRKPVRVVYQDRRHAVVANDGSVPAGVYVAQTGATQLNRMIKSQSGTVPAGFHIHADGSVHSGKH